MELTDAERELIELLRGMENGARDPSESCVWSVNSKMAWTLTISYAPIGHWVVEMKAPNLDGAQGDGRTFSEAWDLQSPNWARYSRALTIVRNRLFHA
jgi:hypothetical protein